MTEPVWPQGDFDALFQRFLSSWDRLFPGWLRPSGWDPSVEMGMENGALLLKVVLPGFAPHEVEVLVISNQINSKLSRLFDEMISGKCLRDTDREKGRHLRNIH